MPTVGIVQLRRWLKYLSSGVLQGVSCRRQNTCASQRHSQKLSAFVAGILARIF
jgi:hypothetical protein